MRLLGKLGWSAIPYTGPIAMVASALMILASFANPASEIASQVARIFSLTGPQLPDTQRSSAPQELVRRVIQLDRLIHQAPGDSA